jgi:hypothetical protein
MPGSWPSATTRTPSEVRGATDQGPCRHPSGRTGTRPSPVTLVVAPTGHRRLRQARSLSSPPWAAMAQITNTSRVMISSDQNG